MIQDVIEVDGRQACFNKVKINDFLEGGRF